MTRLISPDTRRDIYPSTINYSASLTQEMWMPAWYWLYEAWHVPKADRWDYAAMKRHIDTPTKMQAWMYAKLRYTFDIFDRWQQPIETWNKRGGDCEDWAILANDWLRDKYETYFILMFRMDNGTQYGHATLAIKTGNQKWVTVGTFGKQKHRGDWGDIVSGFNRYKNWTKLKVLDPDLNLIHEEHH